MGGGSKASSIIHTIAPLIGAGVGINAALNAATGAYIGTTNAPFGTKLVIFTSFVAGPGAAGPLAKALNININPLPPQQFTPVKALNPISISGAGILIANYILKELGIKGYSQYAAPILGAIGAGTLVGGVVGGIFDPPSNPAAIGNPAGRLAFAQAATPFLGAAGAAMPGTQGGLAGFNTGRGGY